MRILTTVHPNSKNPRVERGSNGLLHVYVNAPPLEGKANEATIKSLAKFLDVKKSEIALIRGDKSKSKVFEIG